MGMMDLFNQGDVRDKLYAAAAKNNVPQGGITGKLFSAMFPHGLGNLAFGREPEPMPPLETPEGTALMADLASNMMVPGTFIGVGGMMKQMGRDKAGSLLAKADSALKGGASKESVFKELGVFRGPEGKWRYEIDDSPSQFLATDGGGGVLSDFLSHSDIYSAYPDVQRIKTMFEPSSTGGAYNWTQDSMEIGGGSPHSIALHELQHAVQGREGFARGGSPNQWEQIANDRLVSLLGKDPRLESAYGKYAALDRAIGMGEDFDPVAYESLESALLSLPNGQEVSTLHGVLSGEGRAAGSPVANDLYQRLAGEAEARAVQDRMNMSMDERRALFPEYAGRDDLIVRGLMSGGK